jgi:hypothetical protein
MTRTGDDSDSTQQDSAGWMGSGMEFFSETLLLLLLLLAV